MRKLFALVAIVAALSALAVAAPAQAGGNLTDYAGKQLPQPPLGTAHAVPVRGTVNVFTRF